MVVLPRTFEELHGDHSKYIPSALKMGLPVYSCQEVADKYKGVQPLYLGKKLGIGGFTIQPMSVIHSCECYSYLIEHPLFGRLLFATDCNSFNYYIKNLNHIFIEANYSDDIILNNICEGSKSLSSYENHLEIEKCIKAIKMNYSSELQTVCLLHLSDYNSDETLFKQKVIDEIGFDNVYVARKGLEIELQVSEF
ncbi:MAG: hypothetical protein ACI4N3_04440 [Alphaproteobacteria bacterium]